MPATATQEQRARELLEAITDADDRVFNARETLDQYADDEPDDMVCAMVRDDSQQLHDAWKAVKQARDAFVAALMLSMGDEAMVDTLEDENWLQHCRNAWSAMLHAAPNPSDEAGKEGL